MKHITNPVLFVLAVFCFFPLVGCADAPQGPLAQAQALMDPAYRSKVFWIKGAGPREKINEWTYYFYDPTAAGNARMVRIVDDKVEIFQPANFGSPARESSTFNPFFVKVSVQKALSTAAAYANEQKISYDHVRVQLRRPSSDQAPSWRVELLENAHNLGTVYISPENGQLVYFNSTRSSPDSAAGFFNDVKRTFLGIGGDLEQFFTGERTVDQ